MIFSCICILGIMSIGIKVISSVSDGSSKYRKLESSLKYRQEAIKLAEQAKIDSTIGNIDKAQFITDTKTRSKIVSEVLEDN